MYIIALLDYLSRYFLFGTHSNHLYVGRKLMRGMGMGLKSSAQNGLAGSMMGEREGRRPQDPGSEDEPGASPLLFIFADGSRSPRSIGRSLQIRERVVRAIHPEQ